jgi:DNA invertase Pin-like site-specific DNA recombinase
MIGQRTSDALQALKASGKRLGRPVEQNPEIMARIVSERTQGLSLRAIAEDLNAERIPTARGGHWHASTVKSILGSIKLDSHAAV